MGHGDYLRQGGSFGWPGIVVFSNADAQKLDEVSSEALAFGPGGVWAPSDMPIWIGGAGIRFRGSWSLQGGCRTVRGGRYMHGDSDYFTFSSSRSRSRRMSLLAARARVSDSDYNETGIATSLSPPGVKTTASGMVMTWPIPAQYLHDGATLSGITIRFRVGTSRPTISSPFNPLALAIARVHGNGTVDRLDAFSTVTGWLPTHAFVLNTLVVPTSANYNGCYFKATAVSGNTGGAEPAWPSVVGATVVDGGVTWTCQGGYGLIANQASAAAWYNNGQPQGFTTNPSQNNVIDLSAYTYEIAITDSDPQAGNTFHSAKLDFTNIADMRPD